ncbi:MAG: hypothetical protein R2911_36670 [Caldilineaceae bacterium]
METSLLWALEPQCVDMSRMPVDETGAPHFAMGPDAIQSDRRIGERMVADEVRWLGQKASALLDQYAENPPATRQPLTFMDIERIWVQEVQPVLPDFKTMKYLERTPPPEDSVWRVNYAIPGVGEY